VSFEKFSKVGDARFYQECLQSVCSMQTDERKKRRARRTWCEVVVTCAHSVWKTAPTYCTVIKSSADRSTYENQLRRPQLFCLRSLCVEQSAERLAVIGRR